MSRNNARNLYRLAAQFPEHKITQCSQPDE